MVEDDADGSHWCILRTSGLRTLKLAVSLSAAGIEAWTPTRKERRLGRGKQRKEVIEQEIAITPSFVFVRKRHLGELLRIRALPVSEHPGFTFLRDRTSIPAVDDRSLAALRAAEERFRRSYVKGAKRKLEVGSRVRMKTGAFAGMTGEVRMGKRGKPVVDLGGIWGEVDIASYLIDTDLLQVEQQSIMDIAA